MPHTLAYASAPRNAQDPVVADEFSRYYLHETRLSAATLFGTVAIALILAPLYRQSVFGAAAPAAVLLIEWGLIIPACLLGAYMRSRPQQAELHARLGLAATVAIAAGLIGVFCAWRQAGVAFPTEFVGLFLIAALALGGLLQSQVLPAALALLAIDAATGYWVDGWSVVANAHAFSDTLTAVLGYIVGQHTERTTQQIWLDARRFERMAGEDPLTRLSNRRAYETHCGAALAQAGREQRRVAVGILDVDCFKEYNDHYGHMTGDGALMLVADALSRAARRPLDAVCRFGGEKFAVFWYDLSPDNARERAEAVVAAVRDLYIPHRHSRVGDRITVSLGAVHFLPGPRLRLADALAAAELRLRDAKDAGRNRAVMHELAPPPS
ncbi:MAG: GGDEF domain-containing protein [Gammaproteobacteria bacterium]|nr:GGDEF domain-containing protein [Gammaproteobacteria bacterium]